MYTIPIQTLLAIHILTTLLSLNLIIQVAVLKQRDIHIMSNVEKPQRNLLVITVDNIGMVTDAVLAAVLVRDQGRVEELYIRPATPVDHLSIPGFWDVIKIQAVLKKLKLYSNKVY